MIEVFVFIVSIGICVSGFWLFAPDTNENETRCTCCFLKTPPQCHFCHELVFSYDARRSWDSYNTTKLIIQHQRCFLKNR
jgi:hypothetical protein